MAGLGLAGCAADTVKTAAGRVQAQQQRGAGYRKPWVVMEQQSRHQAGLSGMTCLCGIRFGRSKTELQWQRNQHQHRHSVMAWEVDRQRLIHWRNAYTQTHAPDAVTQMFL